MRRGLGFSASLPTVTGPIASLAEPQFLHMKDASTVVILSRRTTVPIRTAWNAFAAHVLCCLLERGLPSQFATPSTQY